jgi:hypothetical protein
MILSVSELQRSKLCVYTIHTQPHSKTYDIKDNTDNTDVRHPAVRRLKNIS